MRTRVCLVLVLTYALGGCSTNEELVAEYLQSAKTYQAADQPKLALIELRNLVKRDPTNLEALTLSADLHEELEQWPEMFRSLSRALELDPDSSELKIRLSELYLNAGEIDGAVGLAEQALAENPTGLEELLLISRVRLRQGKSDEARQFAIQARQIEPGNLTAASVEISMLLAEQRMPEAHAVLDAIPDEELLSEAARLQRLRIYAAESDTEKMQEVLQDLISMEKENLEYRTAAASVHLRNGDRESAGLVLRQALKELPSSIDAKLLYAGFVAETDRARAIEQLEAFVEESPAEPTLKMTLAAALRSQGDIDSAAATYRQVVEQNLSYESEVAASNELARIALETDQTPRAMEYIDSVLATDERNPDALLLRAHVRVGEGALDSALADVRSVLGSDARNDQALDMLGRVYLLQGTEALAEDSFRAALDIEPYNANSALSLARILIRRGELDSAARFLRPLVAGQRSNVDVNTLLVQLELALGNWNDAESVANAYPVLADRKSFGQLVKAMVAQGRGEFDKARQMFQELIEQPSVREAAMFGLVATIRQSGASDDAVALLETILRSNSSDKVAILLLAEEYERRGEDTRATDLLDQSVLDHPDWLGGWLASADYSIRRRDFLRAKAAYEAAHRISNNSNILLRLAMTHEALGELDFARERYEDVLRVSPTSDVARNNLAVILSETPGKLEEAFRVALPLQNSNESHFLDTIGWVSARQGKYEQALDLMTRAIEANPGNPEFKYHAGWILHRMKRFEESKRMINEAVLSARKIPESGKYSWVVDAQLLLQQL